LIQKQQGQIEERAVFGKLVALLNVAKDRKNFCFECDIFEQDVFDGNVTEVTGITIKRLSQMADPGETYDKFVAMLDKYVDKFDKTDKFTAIGYGTDFDQDMLRSWFQKNDDDYFGSWFWYPWLCMMNMAAVELRNERSALKNFRLETVAAYLGIKVDTQQVP